MNMLTQFAETGASGNLFTAIGIDWQMLVFQVIAFVVLVWLLGKFVYPPLIKAVDNRQQAIEASTEAAEEARKKAAQAEADVEKMLKEARAQASDIVSTAKEEATAAVEAADAKSKARADHIIAEAHEQIEKDVASARKVLHNETLDLVAQATEKVVGKTVDVKVDDKVISAALKEAK
jgi:F-type H+-transporting ATPase subunit b